jgi:NADPH:quinone reductase-like Zn-dependent oxidoreductase
MPLFHPVQLMRQSKAVVGLNMLTLWDEHGSLGQYVDPLTAWAEDGRIEPVVAESFPLERGADAHRAMHEGRNIGKVVLTP